jgi:hypothetical protein
VHFGLDTLNELPGLDELRAAGLLDLTSLALPERATEQQAEQEVGAEP